MKSQHIIHFDIVRVIACIMVIVMHSPIPGYNASLHGPFLTLTSYLTAPCVPLFFMVSGALLLPRKEGVDAFQYLKKRIGKILYPTVCFSLFYMFINKGNVDSTLLIKNLCSIPFSTQGHGILWFMYVLIGLYLLIPIISPWIRNASQRDIELYLALWMITMLYPFIGLFLEVNTSINGVFYYFAGYSGYFLLGYYINSYGVSLKYIVPLAIAMLLMPILNKVLNWNLDFYSAFWYLSAPVAVMTTAWFCVIKKLFEKKQLPVRLTDFLEIISNLSFGIYLVHIFVMRTLIWKLDVIQNINNYYLQTLVVIFLTFVGSFTICNVIAKLPFASYIIGYTSKKK